MKNKLLILGILVLLPSVLSPARTKMMGRRPPGRISPIYDPNYYSTYISPDIEKYLDHIDPDFLTKTNIIDKLRHTDLSRLTSIEKFINNKSLLYYNQKDFDYSEDNSQWYAKYKKPANQLFTVVCLLVDLNHYPKTKEDIAEPIHRLCKAHKAALLRNKQPHPSSTGIHNQSTKQLKTALDYLYSGKDPSLCAKGSEIFHTLSLAGIDLEEDSEHTLASKQLERVFVVPPRGNDGKLQTRVGGVGYRLKK